MKNPEAHAHNKRVAHKMISASSSEHFFAITLDSNASIAEFHSQKVEQLKLLAVEVVIKANRTVPPTFQGVVFISCDNMDRHIKR